MCDSVPCVLLLQCMSLCICVTLSVLLLYYLCVCVILLLCSSHIVRVCVSFVCVCAVLHCGVLTWLAKGFCAPCVSVLLLQYMSLCHYVYMLPCSYHTV